MKNAASSSGLGANASDSKALSQRDTERERGGKKEEKRGRDRELVLQRTKNSKVCTQYSVIGKRSFISYSDFLSFFTVSDSPDAFNRGMSRGYSVQAPPTPSHPATLPSSPHPTLTCRLLSPTTPPVSFSPHEMGVWGGGSSGGGGGKKKGRKKKKH